MHDVCDLRYTALGVTTGVQRITLSHSIFTPFLKCLRHRCSSQLCYARCSHNRSLARNYVAREQATAAQATMASRPSVSSKLYMVAVQHGSRLIRVVAMGFIYLIMAARSYRLFKRELQISVLTLLVASYTLGCSPLLLVGLVYITLQLWCIAQAANRIEYVRGHRAGAHGYEGPACENTIEALQALVALDNGPDGPLHDLYYVEVDIQETADGKLIVLHDTTLGRAFPNTGPNVPAYEALRKAGLPKPVMDTLIQHLTGSQLRSLHIAGREGVHAPTLDEFLQAFRRLGCRRPMVIEIKTLQTDKGRLRLAELLMQHKPYANQLAQKYPQYKLQEVGFLALIAFPHYYAASFGEFGTQQCKHWTRMYTSLGVPVRCCFLEMLSYARGLTTNC